MPDGGLNPQPFDDFSFRFKGFVSGGAGAFWHATYTLDVGLLQRYSTGSEAQFVGGCQAFKGGNFVNADGGWNDFIVYMNHATGLFEVRDGNNVVQYSETVGDGSGFGQVGAEMRIDVLGGNGNRGSSISAIVQLAEFYIGDYGSGNETLYAAVEGAKTAPYYTTTNLDTSANSAF